MSSSSSSSSSSAALATVTVTARDVEFSNYNSVTGKWGNAVMTMMIEDTNTPDNLNLEVYDEKVYAVFRNHDDPTDLVEFSAEVDGIDFRVTTTDPMVASAKYELYKVYGETSGGEYATSSQFYIQVPGKEWDFANDTVGHDDITLVSDWFNYGHVITSDNVVHGAPTRQDIIEAGKGNVGTTVTVNGETINVDDIIEYKMTSLFTGSNDNRMCSGYNALQNLDIVSSGLTGNNNGGYSLWSTSFNKKFAFPSTFTFMNGWLRNLNNVYNKPIYMPDSVTRVSNFITNGGNGSSYTAKVRFSPNITRFDYYSLNNLTNWNGCIYNLSRNVQLSHIDAHSFAFGFGTSFAKGFDPANPVYELPSAWTYVPSYFMYCGYRVTGDQPYIIVPEGITQIQSQSLRGGGFRGIKTPSTLTSIGDGVLQNIGTSAYPAKIDMSDSVNLTSLSNGVLGGCNIDMSELKLPPNLRTIGSSFLGNAGWSSWGSNYYNCEKDENNRNTYRIPNSITTIGTGMLSYAFNSSNQYKLQHIVVPSSVQSIGAGFLSSATNGNKNNRIIDMYGVSPSVFSDNDTSSFTSNNTTFSGEFTVNIDPGTKEEWEAKLPDIIQNGVYRRRIFWVEKPTPYAYVFYRPGIAKDSYTKIQWTGEEKMIEIESQAEFEQLCNSGVYWHTTFTRDGEPIDIYAELTSLYSEHNIFTKVIIGTDVTSIPNYFMARTSLIQKMSFQDNPNLTSIGNNFCTSNSTGTPVEYGTGQSIEFSWNGNFPSGVTTIGDSFLRSRANFDHSVNLPTGLTSLGQMFMYDCRKFNSSVTIPSGLTSLNYGFLGSCTSFNQPITFPDTLTSFGYFLFTRCTSFNQPITVPSGISTIAAGFLSDCTSFNQTITFPSSVTTLNYSFMQNCSSFNQPLNLDNVSVISYGFMQNCTSFNQPLTLKNKINTTGSFLSGCTSFNSKITFAGKRRTIGSNFLSGCTAFNQDISIPEQDNDGQTYKISSAGFMANCNSMMSIVDFGTNAVSDFDGDMSQNTFLATQDDTSDLYTKGVYIVGDHKDDIAAAAVPYDGTQATPAGYYRNVKEYPTYGVLYYKTSASDPDSDEKEVELQSAAEFNSLVSTQGGLWSQWTVTVGANQVQVTNGGYNYSTATNVITGVRIGDSVTSIPNFWMCFVWGLSHIDGGIPKWVTSIGNKEFFACYSLTNLDIKCTSATIGNEFAYDCNRLLLNFDDNSTITSVGNRYLSSSAATSHEYVLPNGITTVSTNLFNRNWFAAGHPVVLPSTITSIGGGAFCLISSGGSADDHLLLDVGDLPATVCSTANGEDVPFAVSGSTTGKTIYIKGSTAANWVARFPDLPDSVDTTHYRHLEVYQEPSS